jgi:hypothetical protein
MRAAPDGQIYSLDLRSGEETLLSNLSFGAPAYRTSLSGCLQVANPAEAMPPVVGGGDIALPVKYDGGSCPDKGLVTEVYGTGVGLLQRSVTTLRGQTDYRLAWAKVGGKVVGTRNRELLLSYEFDFGANGWRGGFSDYSLVTSGTRTIAEIRRLPEPLGADRSGFFLQSMNRSDDLFMFLKKVVTAEDGIAADRKYRLAYEITFLSNAESGCAGVGGAPGEGVYLKAGASADEPVSILRAGQHLEMNIDKGYQSGGGVNAGVVGNIANGTPCSGVDEPPYVRVRKIYRHQATVQTDSRNEMWLIAGTDSAYEGLTGMFIEKIAVRLTPVDSE